ncbi:MAG TPA: PRC-barrel domain-containing protein [Capillimicrobium sp.]|jgi:uncharacterized protein YrrD
MDDLGARTSYLAVERGVDVFDAAGERIGALDHVLADEEKDIFDGLIIDTRGLLGGHRFADAEQVGDLYERGVVLKVGHGELHEPTENAATMAVDPDDTADRPIAGRLRRAWDWISGNY